HVAGLAALVFTTVTDVNGNGYLNDEVRSRIESTCDDIGISGIGSGRINAARAVGDVAPVLPGRISGQVTDAEDGSAISGARVSDGTRTVLTDVTGQYAINDVPSGSYEVVAGKEGYESSSLTVNVFSETTAVADFLLSEIVVPGTITGSVTDAEDGSPVAGAVVTDGTRTVLTDAAGQYTISDVPPGTYQVVAGKEGYESLSLTVTVLEETTAVVDFSLSQIIVLGSITGTVTDTEDGSPVAGATVSDGTRTTTTDATGEYNIANMPPGTYQVTASKSGYESSSLTVTVLEGNTAVSDLSLVRIIVPGTITGSVTDAEDGSPVAGAVVTDGTRMTTTDATGEYTIANVPPGTYQVTASKAGYHSSSLTVTVLSGGTAIANFSLNEVIVPGSITGSVTDVKDGSPIVGATVSDGTRTTITDASGIYTVANVPPGTYQVTTSKEGYVSVTLTATLVSGGTSVMNFYLNPKPAPNNTMWVDSIRFITCGKNLFIEIEVATASGVLSAVKVEMSLECSNGEVWNFSGTTNTPGLVKFKLGKAPIGNYLTTVNSLTCSGFVWDMSKGFTSTSYALGL
ncbi:MAG TPA: carboxypeptidase regulatory-like domain-containing protein, partial [Dehalococcoidia bacterium]|nr:carboxypeptidase regulatory-like domain-containing protein [Dehalococcoidia bacterium]